MALSLTDPNCGHNTQLELARYHLENAGAILFSVKPQSKSDRPCDDHNCHHLIDIIPLPLNFKIILQRQVTGMIITLRLEYY
jgi:hypothetical protein